MNEWMDGWMDWRVGRWVGTSSIIVTDWLVITLKTAVISSGDTIKYRGKWITLYYAETHKNLSFVTYVTRENRNLNYLLHIVPAVHVYPSCYC